MHELRAILEANKSAKAGREFLSEEGWDRKTNSWEMQISTKGLASKGAITSCLEGFIEGAFTSDQREIVGADQPLAKKWKLVWKGGAATGTRRDEKCWRLLRKENGELQELWVRAPDNSLVRLFISKDKSGKMVATEILVKKILQVAKQVHPDLAWGSARVDASVTIDWKPALLAVLKIHKSYEIQFNSTVTHHYKVDIQAIKDGVAEIFGRTAQGVQWSL